MGMRAVAECQHNMLFVDRTGGGRSSVIHGSYQLEDEVTICLSPAKSLKAEIGDRCDKVHIPAVCL